MEVGEGGLPGPGETAPSHEASSATPAGPSGLSSSRPPSSTARGGQRGDKVLSLLREGQQKMGAFIVRDQRQRDRENALRYILKGMGKGFLVYTAPLIILQRKVSPFTLRRGAVVSIFVGLVRSFYRWHRWLRVLDPERDAEGRERYPLVKKGILLFQQRLPWMGIAGGAAALIGLRIDPSLLNSTLAFWCLVRAARCLPLPQWKFGPTLIMCLSATMILSTWIAAPEDLPEGYLRFLDKQGMINAAMKKRLMNGERFCHVTHADRSHFAYLWGFLLKSLLLSLRVYVPLNLIFFLAGRKDANAAKRALKNIVRSTAFLTAYCTTAISTGCLLYSNFDIKLSRVAMMGQAWTAGLATLIEIPSRQAELAAYCLPFALETLYRFLQRAGWVEAKPWRTTAVTVLSVAVLIQNLHHQPRVLNWLFGIM